MRHPLCPLRFTSSRDTSTRFGHKEGTCELLSCSIFIGLTKAPSKSRSLFQTVADRQTGCLRNAQDHALIHHKAQTVKKICKAIFTSPLSFIIHLFPKHIGEIFLPSGSSSAGSTRIQQNAVFRHTFAEANALPPAPNESKADPRGFCPGPAR